MCGMSLISGPNGEESVFSNAESKGISLMYFSLRVSNMISGSKNIWNGTGTIGETLWPERFGIL